MYSITKKLTEKLFVSFKQLKNSDRALCATRSEQLEIWRLHDSGLQSNSAINSVSVCSCNTHTVRQDIAIDYSDITAAVDATNELKNNNARAVDNMMTK